MNSPKILLVFPNYKKIFAVIFRQKLLKNRNFFRKLMMNEISDFCRQYQYLQLQKTSGVEVEIPVHKTLAMDLLKGWSYRTPLGLKGLI